MAKILVIDDDPLILNFVTDALKAVGHTVVQARDGDEGLAASRAATPDLVITDMVMPNLDGVQLIDLLLKEQPDLPIVAMSGAPDSAQYLHIASFLGAGRLLTKPFSVTALREAVDEAL